MGVGGGFWDLLKPYARAEGFDYLREKRVAVDLSFWVVQHETAIKADARNPHIRLIFFRTINLFSKFGAFPVFVVDGTPSPLKSEARIARFFRSSGIDTSSVKSPQKGVSVNRNKEFTKCVKDCVELLELFGLPVVKANGEAEALCAQLNREGHVDACITSDSDAFLYGAKCVIKSIRPNTKEPFECYHITDIEAGLGLKRNHLIAISLLVGNDHDLSGVQGVGLDTALRFVNKFSEDEILDKLHKIGNGDNHLLHGGVPSTNDIIVISDESSPKKRCSHCSFCGHPGSKRAHFKSSCEHCGTTSNGECIRKPKGFKCNCSSCLKGKEEKKQKQSENWWVRVCEKLTMTKNFPNTEIIDMYLCKNHGQFTADDGPPLSWEHPNTDMIVSFLVYRQNWEPSYIRQRMLPMSSTIYLRKMACNPTEALLCDQYEFHSIQRIKKRYGHQFFVVKWKKATPDVCSPISTNPVEESNLELEQFEEANEPVDLLNDSIEPQIYVDNGCWYMLTDEDMGLIHSAFPTEAARFLQEKELKESKRRKTPISEAAVSSEKFKTPKSKGTQLSITEFYRSTKGQSLEKSGEDLLSTSSFNRSDESSKGKRKLSSPNLPKSVRRRLLFG